MLGFMWNMVQDNIGRFQTMFGKENTYIVDNSDGKDDKIETMLDIVESGLVEKTTFISSREKVTEQQKKQKTR